MRQTSTKMSNLTELPALESTAGALCRFSGSSAGAMSCAACHWNLEEQLSV